MRLSLTSWSLPSCSLEEAAGISRVLGVKALDIGYFYRPALDREALLAEPAAVAARVRDLGIATPCHYHLFGNGLGDRNLADPGSLPANLRDFESVLAFCRAAGVPTVFVLPGIINPGQSREQACAASAAALTELVAMAADAGITLTIEPHVHSCLESPGVTLRLLERVPGLRLTLDLAHFICLGWRQEEVDPLIPHAGHIHLRQARPGALQTKMAEGTINMGAQFAALRDAGFDGWMALEYVHQDYMATLYDDVLTETIKMRDAFRAWSV